MLHLVTFVFCLTYILPGFGNSDKPHPHIIIIVADDLGWNDVSIHGSSQIPTPNIDALGIHGIVLGRYYVTPLCTPSRSALMTGRYPIHTGMQNDVLYASEPWGLPLSFPLLPEHLAGLGYSRHIVGKWHLGHFHRRYTPTFRGFQSHYGYWTGHEDYYDHTAQEGEYWGYDFRRNMTVDRKASGIYATDLLTNESLTIIRSHDPSAPLFLYIAHLGVHSGNPYQPLQAPSEYIKRFSHIKDIKRRTYAAMVTKVDESVGYVIEALHKKDMLRDAIILFSTDNGGPAQGFNQNAASNWPLRGVKATLWEGGIRGVGLLWKAKLKKPGRVYPDLVHISDWLPTLYSAAGGNPMDLDAGIDGVDVWKALINNKSSPRREILHNIETSSGIYASLMVDNWKLITGEIYGGEWNGWYGPSGHENDTQSDHRDKFHSTSLANQLLARFRREKARHTEKQSLKRVKKGEVTCGPPPPHAMHNCQGGRRPCLFNVLNDPCEYVNVASEQPDILAQLLRRLQHYNQTAVPPLRKPSDPRANPIYWNYTWTNWMDYVSVQPTEQKFFYF